MARMLLEHSGHHFSQVCWRRLSSLAVATASATTPRGGTAASAASATKVATAADALRGKARPPMLSAQAHMIALRAADVIAADVVVADRRAVRDASLRSRTFHLLLSSAAAVGVGATVTPVTIVDIGATVAAVIDSGLPVTPVVAVVQPVRV